MEKIASSIMGRNFETFSTESSKVNSAETARGAQLRCPSHAVFSTHLKRISTQVGYAHENLDSDAKIAFNDEFFRKYSMIRIIKLILNKLCIFQQKKYTLVMH
jgi:hypothetical protein